MVSEVFIAYVALSVQLVNAQGDYVGAAAKAAGELYGYGHTNVLFKPTKAAWIDLFIVFLFERHRNWIY